MAQETEVAEKSQFFFPINSVKAYDRIAVNLYQ
jgi:hypothetical protein